MVILDQDNPLSRYAFVAERGTCQAIGQQGVADECQAISPNLCIPTNRCAWCKAAHRLISGSRRGMENERRKEVNKCLAADDDWSLVGWRQADAQAVAGAVRRTRHYLFKRQIGQASSLGHGVVLAGLRSIAGE